MVVGSAEREEGPWLGGWVEEAGLWEAGGPGGGGGRRPGQGQGGGGGAAGDAPPAWRVTFDERKTIFCSWHHYFTCLTLVNSMKLQAIRMNRF